MSDAEAAPAPDDRILGVPAAGLIIALLVVRVVVAILLIAWSGRIEDEGILRYDRVAASPVTPYRNFQVEWMPVQTAVVQAVGGRGGAATAAGVTVVAVVADAAVAAALVRGWGLRTAANYLLLGLPLLGVAYARLDLIAVAFAAWAFAGTRRGRDGPAGVALGLAALSGLWAAFLLPWVTLRRRRRPTLVWAAAVLAAGGAAWFLVGGPKGPMQVLSYRGATGWDVQSTVGSLLQVFTDGATFLEGGILRIGFASSATRTAILALVLGATAMAWLRWRSDGDPASRPALGITATILALSPTFPAEWTAILVPWTALMWDEDRRIALAAVVAIALTGVLTAVSPAAESTALTTAIVLVRQVALMAVAGWALVLGRRA